MPRLDGFALLKLLQSDRELSTLPVVVLSSSILEVDKEKAMKLGACEALTKPVDIAGYRELVAGLRQRWLEHTV